MDAETQLLELPPDATLVYRAPNQLEQAHCPANHGHKDTGSALSAPVAALNLSVHVHDGQVQPALTSPNSSPELTASANLAGGSQLIGTAAEASIEKQPSASVSNAMVQSYSLPAAKAASHDSGSGMNALLQAMLTGELA